MASVPSVTAGAYPRNKVPGNTVFHYINPFCRKSNIEIRGGHPRWNDVIAEVAVFPHLS
jgi:hypothetical protein